MKLSIIVAASLLVGTAVAPSARANEVLDVSKTTNIACPANLEVGACTAFGVARIIQSALNKAYGENEEHRVSPADLYTSYKLVECQGDSCPKLERFLGGMESAFRENPQVSIDDLWKKDGESMGGIFSDGIYAHLLIQFAFKHGIASTSVFPWDENFNIRMTKFRVSRLNRIKAKLKKCQETLKQLDDPSSANNVVSLEEGGRVAKGILDLKKKKEDAKNDFLNYLSEVKAETKANVEDLFYPQDPDPRQQAAIREAIKTSRDAIQKKLSGFTVDAHDYEIPDKTAAPVQCRKLGKERMRTITAQLRTGIAVNASVYATQLPQWGKINGDGEHNIIITGAKLPDDESQLATFQTLALDGETSPPDLKEDQLCYVRQILNIIPPGTLTSANK